MTLDQVHAIVTPQGRDVNGMILDVLLELHVHIGLRLHGVPERLLALFDTRVGFIMLNLALADLILRHLEPEVFIVLPFLS